MSETCVKAQCQMTAECKRRECILHARDEFGFSLPDTEADALTNTFTASMEYKMKEAGIDKELFYPNFTAFLGVDAIYINCGDVLL